MTKIVAEILEILRVFIKEKFADNIREAARNLPVKEITLRQWLDGSRKPKLVSLEPLLPYLGISFGKKEAEADKDVCFVNAMLAEASDNIPPPSQEDYIAAPLVGEAGAGPGYLPEESVKSWFLVFRNLPAIRHRRNLIAVEIAKGSVSMQPTLNPGDIVLVDRDDRSVSHPGHIMLVRDPLDGSGMIKRVSVQDEKPEVQITFYSDNAAHYPPQVYSVAKDFDGDLDKAIVGRVIWAWSDMRGK